MLASVSRAESSMFVFEKFAVRKKDAMGARVKKEEKERDDSEKTAPELARRSLWHFAKKFVEF